MFNKKTRTIDKQLMKEYHNKKCILCSLRATPSHIKTRGAGGPDLEFNIVPLCFYHHVEWGKIGAITFCLKYPVFMNHLRVLGWYIDNGKLFNDKLT